SSNSLLFPYTTLFRSLSKEESVNVFQYIETNYQLKAIDFANDLETMLSTVNQNSHIEYVSLIEKAPVDEHLKFETGFNLFKHKIPMWLFLIAMIFLCIWSFKKNLSLIPMLGLICCIYMMAELTIWNWVYFSAWLLIGLIIYFSYSRFHSKLNDQPS